jgi:uncharacterized protein YbjT (DUF2867 family)
MRVFLTGATGFIGSYLVPELINAGHHAVGLSRSDAGAETLTRAGAEVFRSDVNDLDRLRTAAEAADGVIHAAFNHDFSNLKQHSEDDRKVIETLGRGTGRLRQAASHPLRHGPRPVKNRRPSGRDRRSRHLGGVPSRSLRGSG